MKKIFSNKKVLYFIVAIVTILVVLGFFGAGYYIAKISFEKENRQLVEKIKEGEIEKNRTEESLKQLQEKIKEYNEIGNSEAIDYKENKKEEEEFNLSLEKQEKQEKQENKKNIAEFKKKPKLVIIMDDMSFYWQVKELINLKLPITPSFFPPTKRHPKTPIYAKKFSHFMVHFPMQAMSKSFPEEENTLHVGDNYKTILDRVKAIKKNFPKVKFVNNHTGSKFTSDLRSMRILFSVLNNEDLLFLDSKTTSKTKAPQIWKEHNYPLLSRNIFLDNEENVTYIKNQIKRAVRIAVKRGYAIAICHPHSKTFQALRESKDMFKKVELLYIDQLYKLLYG
jgi:polysaccharide deacetylase 2 family uncharacterized protein YibQ